MTLFHLFIVAIVQGVTEFLPVSSSGHLILLPRLTGLDDQGLEIDVAVHVGTLLAVILYFRAEVAQAAGGVPRLLMGRMDTNGARLAFMLLVSTIPVALVGAVLKLTGLSEAMRSVALIGWAMLGFGIILYLADKFAPERKTDKDWTIRDALLIGVAQALALIPGTSRSGVTITAARAIGYGRIGAARIAMLMSIPTIIASAVLIGVDLDISHNATILRDSAIAAGFSFIAALIALVLMMRLLRSVSFTPYVIYRIALGGVLLWIAYS